MDSGPGFARSIFTEMDRQVTVGTVVTLTSMSSARQGLSLGSSRRDGTQCHDLWKPRLTRSFNPLEPCQGHVPWGVPSKG